MMFKTFWCIPALPISSLFPYLYFMIKDFHVAKREEDIGFYAGFVGNTLGNFLVFLLQHINLERFVGVTYFFFFLASSFMIGRALTSILWGKLADRYGRKPIILMGTFSVLALIFKKLISFSCKFFISDTLFSGSYSIPSLV